LDDSDYFASAIAAWQAEEGVQAPIVRAGMQDVYQNLKNFLRYGQDILEKNNPLMPQDPGA